MAASVTSAQLVAAGGLFVQQTDMVVEKLSFPDKESFSPSTRALSTT